MAKLTVLISIGGAVNQLSTEKAGEPGDPTEAKQLLGALTTTLNDWIRTQQFRMAQEV